MLQKRTLKPLSSLAKLLKTRGAKDKAAAAFFEIEVDKSRGESVGLLVENRADHSIKIAQIKPGLISDWNVQHPDLKVAAGDYITEINGVSGNLHALVVAVSQSSKLKMTIQRGEMEKEAAVARIERKRKIPSVTSQRYARVPPKAIGLGGKSTVAVLRASGAISGRTSSGRSGRSSGIVAASVIKEARKLRKMRSVKAVVLRVDSPGGDALSSDLMWRELRLLAATKPLVASMSDVAASGGYYMSMAAPKIVAEGLTLTGSIGIITGKFQFSDLYQRVGFGTELISRGKFAEASADNRPYTEEEEAYVKANAQKSYTLFRDTAAFSRNLTIHATEAVAQGRVWTGRQAKGAGLVDALGGLWTAIALAKKEAKIDGDVRVFEAGLRRSRAPDVVGAAAAAAYNALVGAVLGSDAQLLTGLSHGNAPQAFAPGLDPSLVGESTFGFASPPAEDDGGLWQ